MTPFEQIEKYKRLRNRARTDLLFLCNKVLGYPDVNAAVHGPIIDTLQKFQGGEDLFAETGQLIHYTPAVKIYDLPGSRRRLFLDPRGFLKTTLITVAHTIQWILNYPNVRILICHATGDRAKEILSEIKSHWQYNEVFREIFFDHVPEARKVGDYGNQEQFTTKARMFKHLKEATVQVSSIESTTAGTHMEVIKCSDIVEKENVRTPDRIRQIKTSFAQLKFLLDQPARAWMDVEGTCYDFSDIYNTIMDAELKKPADTRTWQIHRRGIRTDGVPLWPERFPNEAIEAIRQDPTMDTYTFMAQYMNECVSAEDAYFTPEMLKFIPHEYIKQFCHRFHVTVDLANPDPLADRHSSGDFAVLAVCGFDRNGRMYLADLRRGRFKPDEVISQIFDIFDKWHPWDYKIEDAVGARTLFPYLQRESFKRQKFPVVSLIKRDNRVSKRERISGLQAWFKAGDIRIADNIPFREELILEFTRFPRYSHDDIADTIADQIQNRGFYGPEAKPEEQRAPWIPPPFEGFEELVEDTSGRCMKTGL